MTIDSYIHKIAGGSAAGPLFLVLHGTGADENQFFGLARDLLPEATVVAPRGDVSEHGAARYFRRTGEGVYDMDDLARATQKMRDFVKAHRDAARPSAVIGLGYSNGANILASVLFEEPGLFDAAVLMHPLIPFEPEIRGSLSGSSTPVRRPTSSGMMAAMRCDRPNSKPRLHSFRHGARPEAAARR
jgi:phospholipase/carboxylesterase